MSYQTKLVGQIDVEQGLSIEINGRHFSSLDTLVDDYGWLGKGFKSILENTHINGILSDNGIGSLALDENGIQGLDNVAEPERKILEQILAKQYSRSQKLLTAAKSNELDQYDEVSWGVLKGVVLGAAIGGILDGAGLKGTGYQLIARLGPGALESSGISHQVLEKKGAKSPEELPWYGKAGRFFWELGADSVEIVKRVPGGFYSAINVKDLLGKGRNAILPQSVNGKLDRILGVKNRELETNTEIWSEAQEDAPYKGLIGIAVLKSVENCLPGPLYNALESLAVFWVNTGNNVQGLNAVFKKLYNESPSYITSRPKKILEASKRLTSDPFQLANVIVCSAWYGAEVAIRSLGFRPEEQFGNLGAGLESAVLSMDTAAAAQIAKPIAYSQVVFAPKKDVSTPYLLNLARKYDSEVLSKSLADNKGPIKSMEYMGSRLLLTTYDTISTMGRYAHAGVGAIRNLINPNKS